MASVNFTSISGYQHHGKSFPISTLTSDPLLIRLADKLHQQAKDADKAHQDGRAFIYQAIPIPAKFQHIFGN